MAPKSTTTEITIKPIERAYLTVTLQGLTPLICNNFSESAKQGMRDKQQKKARAAKEAKDPEKCFRESMYYTPEGAPAFPASGIKKACVDACSFIDGMTKVAARGAFFIVGDMLPIRGEPTLREDITRLMGKTADLRYRAMFPKWEVDMSILYNPRVISAENIINLLENAGFSIGIGDWRPQKSGSFGAFRVKSEPAQ